MTVAALVALGLLLAAVAGTAMTASLDIPPTHAGVADRPISDDDLSAPEEEPGQAEPQAADDGEAAEHDPAPEDGGDSEDQPPS